MEGQLEQRGDRWQLTFVRQLRHSREKVWRALTEDDHLEAWFPTTIEGEWTAGAPLLFHHRGHDVPPESGEMITFDPPSLLEFRWGEDDTLRFELRAEGQGTTLTLVNEFGELGKAARDAAGWHTCLDLLVHSLDGTEPPWSSEERWLEVRPGYTDRFPDDASAIGPPEGFEVESG